MSNTAISMDTLNGADISSVPLVGNGRFEFLSGQLKKLLADAIYDVRTTPSISPLGETFASQLEGDKNKNATMTDGVVAKSRPSSLKRRRENSFQIPLPPSCLLLPPPSIQKTNSLSENLYAMEGCLQNLRAESLTEEHPDMLDKLQEIILEDSGHLWLDFCAAWNKFESRKGWNGRSDLFFHFVKILSRFCSLLPDMVLHTYLSFNDVSNLYESAIRSVLDGRVPKCSETIKGFCQFFGRFCDISVSDILQYYGISLTKGNSLSPVSSSRQIMLCICFPGLDLYSSQIDNIEDDSPRNARQVKLAAQRLKSRISDCAFSLWHQTVRSICHLIIVDDLNKNEVDKDSATEKKTIQETYTDEEILPLCSALLQCGRFFIGTHPIPEYYSLSAKTDDSVPIILQTGKHDHNLVPSEVNDPSSLVSRWNDIFILVSIAIVHLAVHFGTESSLPDNVPNLSLAVLNALLPVLAKQSLSADYFRQPWPVFSTVVKRNIGAGRDSQDSLHMWRHAESLRLTIVAVENQDKSSGNDFDSISLSMILFYSCLEIMKRVLQHRKKFKTENISPSNLETRIASIIGSLINMFSGNWSLDQQQQFDRFWLSRTKQRQNQRLSQTSFVLSTEDDWRCLVVCLLFSFLDEYKLHLKSLCEVSMGPNLSSQTKTNNNFDFSSSQEDGKWKREIFELTKKLMESHVTTSLLGMFSCVLLPDDLLQTTFKRVIDNDRDSDNDRDNKTGESEILSRVDVLILVLRVFDNDNCQIDRGQEGGEVETTAEVLKILERLRAKLESAIFDVGSVSKSMTVDMIANTANEGITKTDKVSTIDETVEENPSPSQSDQRQVILLCDRSSPLGIVSTPLVQDQVTLRDKIVTEERVLTNETDYMPTVSDRKMGRKEAIVKFPVLKRRQKNRHKTP